MRTVEVMVPCPWYPEAVKLLNENPGLEVGVHLVLTSEWENFKCRPLTNAPSLVDENGYFYPMVWPNKNFPDGTAFVNVKWKKEEVEKELRAQIDLALKNIPRINHLSPHMAVMKSSPELEKVFEKVAKEYNLKYEYSLGITRIKGLRDHNKTPVEKETALLKILEQLQPGSWMLLRHPALDTPEMRAISHKGYENVAADRIGDTFIFTSDKVKKIIKKISFGASPRHPTKSKARLMRAAKGCRFGMCFAKNKALSGAGKMATLPAIIIIDIEKMLTC